MIENVEEAYFHWITEVLSAQSHRELLRLMHRTRFVPRMRMDRNRLIDGLALRKRFAYDCMLSEERIASAMSHIPCSVLEMMAALSLRCEEHIMSDPDYGDRTDRWFFGMLYSLGLERMDDRNFRPWVAADILDRFQRGDYAPNGCGGLFTVDSGRDMRELEIWEQAMLYFTSLYERR